MNKNFSVNFTAKNAKANGDQTSICLRTGIDGKRVKNAAKRIIHSKKRNKVAQKAIGNSWSLSAHLHTDTDSITAQKAFPPARTKADKKKHLQGPFG